MKRLAIPGLIVIVLAILVTPARADRLEELEKRLQIMREQQLQMQAEQQKLLQEIERLKAEQGRLREEQAKTKLSEEEAKRVVAGQAPGQEGPAKETLSIERLLVTRGNVLLSQGQIEIEPSFQYAHFSSQQLAVSGFAILPSLVIGQISTQRIQRDILIPAITVRGGIFDWLQADAVVPYRWQRDRITDSLATVEGEATNAGIGDIEGGLSLQVLRERGLIPDMILGFRYKTRTGEDPFEVQPKQTIGGTTLFEPALGTGFETYRPGLTLVKSVDPAIIFGGVGVVLSQARDVTLQNNRVAEIDPGNSWEFNVGFAFALNPDISLNAQYVQRFTGHTNFKSDSLDIELPGTTLNVGTANFGFTWALSRYLAMDFALGIGLTEDAPAVTAQIRFPIRFSIK